MGANKSKLNIEMKLRSGAEYNLEETAPIQLGQRNNHNVSSNVVDVHRESGRRTRRTNQREIMGPRDSPEDSSDSSDSQEDGSERSIASGQINQQQMISLRSNGFTVQPIDQIEENIQAISTFLHRAIRRSVHGLVQIGRFLSVILSVMGGVNVLLEYFLQQETQVHEITVNIVSHRGWLYNYMFGDDEQHHTTIQALPNHR